MSVTNTKSISKTRMFALVKGLDCPAVRDALALYPEASSYRNERGKNLLHLCCGIDITKQRLLAADSVKMAGVLLEASIDLNEPAFTEGEWKATPLWFAIAHGQNLELAAFLIERGADPEHCMWAAAYNNNPDAIKLLVAAGAQADPHGDDTPFMFAIKWSRFDSARALLDAGANVNFQDPGGRTALHCLLKKRSAPEFVRMLLEHRARLDLADKEGITAKSLLLRMRAPEYRELATEFCRN